MRIGRSLDSSVSENLEAVSLPFLFPPRSLCHSSPPLCHLTQRFTRAARKEWAATASSPRLPSWQMPQAPCTGEMRPRPRACTARRLQRLARKVQVCLLPNGLCPHVPAPSILPPLPAQAASPLQNEPMPSAVCPPCISQTYALARQASLFFPGPLIPPPGAQLPWSAMQSWGRPRRSGRRATRRSPSSATTER